MSVEVFAHGGVRMEGKERDKTIGDATTTVIILIKKKNIKKSKCTILNTLKHVMMRLIALQSFSSIGSSTSYL